MVSEGADGISGVEDRATDAEVSGTEGETGTVDEIGSVEDAVQEIGATDATEAEDKTTAIYGKEPGETADGTKHAEIIEGTESGKATEEMESAETAGGTEPDSSTNPKEISVGYNYYGETSNRYGDTKDYYFFTLKKASQVTVSAKSEVGDVYTSVTIFGDRACTNKIKGGSWDEFTYTVKLDPGTYYVLVTSGLSMTSHYGYKFMILLYNGKR